MPSSPQKAYFGQKDAQQAAVIRQMTRDLNFPIEIVVCPIVREPDGLAMSSRNVYLTPEQRQAAPVLHRALLAAQAAYSKGERSAQKLLQAMTPFCKRSRWRRCSMFHALTTRPCRNLSSVTGKALLSMAVFFGNTRLIDNLVLG